MFNKYFFVAVLFLSGCSSIPEISVPDLLPNLPFLEPTEGAVDAEAEPETLLTGYESRGDGYLSFIYNSGHLKTITVKLKNEQIVLSKGQTVIKKLPVGTYSFDVLGNQTDTRGYSAKLAYDGDTREFIFDIPSQY